MRVGSEPTEDRVAIVTGVGRAAGIGAAIARTLAEDGLRVFTTWWAAYDAAQPWRPASGEPQAILDELRRLGPEADGMEADLADPAGPALIFDAAVAHFGHVDVLVNNAAHSVPGQIRELTAAILDATHAVNLRGMALLCAEYARRHSGRPHGRIINLTSGQGLHPMPGELAYAATKGAVEAFTLSLSGDHDLAGHGVTVNAVDPGPNDTGWMSDELRGDLLARSPRGRLGRPADAASLIRFLASPAAEWVTGQIIHSRGSS